VRENSRKGLEGGGGKIYRNKKGRKTRGTARMQVVLLAIQNPGNKMKRGGDWNPKQIGGGNGTAPRTANGEKQENGKEKQEERTGFTTVGGRGKKRGGYPTTKEAGWQKNVWEKG